jgi:TRAP-type C4-dicarboxylate transport system permease small subunit
MAAPSPYDSENPVARTLGPVVRWLQILCGWALLAICFATLYDIVARRLLGHSVQGVNEVGAYLLAIVSAFGFSSALLQKAHSRVDFLFSYMPPILVAVLNLVAMGLLFGLAAISAWQGWHVLEESLLFDSRAPTPLQTPMWIPQGLWLAGLGVFAGVTFACAIHAVILFVVDRKRLNTLYGPLSVEGQIEVETQGTLPADALGKAPP